jgi:hypothetical protein
MGLVAGTVALGSRFKVKAQPTLAIEFQPGAVAPSTPKFKL